MKKLLMALFVCMFIFTLSACADTTKKPIENIDTSSEEAVYHFLNVADMPSVNASADCTVIQDAGKTIMIDAGWKDKASQEKIVKYLRQIGVEKIDHLILTHSHSDHAGGLPYIIERFDIGTYYAKPANWELLMDAEKADGTPGYYNDAKKAIEEKINSDETKPTMVIPNTEGKKVEFGTGSYFEIYNATTIFEEQVQDDDYNNFSFAVKFVSKHAKLYVGGDSTSRLDSILRNKVGECQIVKLPHHGTTGPYSSAQLLNELKPKYAIVSGLNQFFGKDTEQRCKNLKAEIYTSENHGNIKLNAKNGVITVKTEKIK